MRADETDSEAKRQFSDRNKDVLMNVQSPHKFWFTLKSAVFERSGVLPTTQLAYRKGLGAWDALL